MERLRDDDDVYVGGYDALDMGLEDESGGDEHFALDEEETPGGQEYDGECNFSASGVSRLRVNTGPKPKLVCREDMSVPYHQYICEKVISSGIIISMKDAVTGKSIQETNAVKSVKQTAAEEEELSSPSPPRRRMRAALPAVMYAEVNDRDDSQTLETECDELLSIAGAS